MGKSMSFAALGAIMLAGAAPAGFAAEVPSARSQPASHDCEPVGALNFLCGLGNAEDLVSVPGTRWIIAGGIGTRRGVEARAGLRLIDAETGEWRHWQPDGAWIARHDAAAFPACTTPPDASRFMAHGIALARRAGGSLRLYAVNHAERESIEVFDVDFAAEKPTATWVGCLLPKTPLNTNSVAVAPDGTVYATVFIQPGKSIDDVLAGRQTGEVIFWRPGAATSESLPGTQLSGNNGLEISPDGTRLYVVAFGGKALHIFDRQGQAKGVARLGGNYWPDNVRWDDQGRLIVAGMTTNDPACDKPEAANSAPGTPCYKAYVIEAVDPETLTVETIATESTTPAFSHVSAALVRDGRAWIGTVGADRLAYRPVAESPVR